MACDQGFVRLNREQKRALEIIKAFNGEEELIAQIESDSLEGISYVRLAPILRELENVGYIVVEKDSHGHIVKIYLSSWCFCYRSEYFRQVVFPAAVRGLAGISGGVAVWLLTKFFA